MPAPEILVFSTLATVVLLAILILALKSRRGKDHLGELEEEFVRLDACVAEAPVREAEEESSEFEPAYESDFALSSIESLELVDEDREFESAETEESVAEEEIAIFQDVPGFEIEEIEDEIDEDEPVMEVVDAETAEESPVLEQVAAFDAEDFAEPVSEVEAPVEEMALIVEEEVIESEEEAEIVAEEQSPLELDAVAEALE